MQLVFPDFTGETTAIISSSDSVETGIISYSPEVDQNELLKEIEALLKQPSRSYDNSENFSLNSKLERNPITIYSCVDGKTTNALKLTHNEAMSSFSLNGNINYLNPTIEQKITPDENGFYFAIAFSDELKQLLAPTLKDYISKSALENIEGFELNYLGVEVDNRTNKPTPNFNLHIQANAQINGSITFINSLGNIVHTEALNFQNKIIKQMNLDYLAQGMYFAKIEFNNNFHLTKFIIVK
mgnify:CR=1 FL=1